MLTVSEVKQHLRIDHNADDTLLAAYIQAAENYMASAIDEYEEKLAYSATTSNDRWGNAARLAEMQMIAQWYEDRLPQKDIAHEKITSVQAIIQQLQYCPPKGYSE